MDEIYEGMPQAGDSELLFERWCKEVELAGARAMSYPELWSAFRDAKDYGPASAFTSSTGRLVQHIYRLIESHLALLERIDDLEDATDLFIEDDPLSIYADREPTMDEDLTPTFHEWGNVQLRQW